MSVAVLPWLGVALLLPLLGAAGMPLLRQPGLAARWSLGILLATLAAGLGTAVTYFTSAQSAGPRLGPFQADDLAAPMLPVLGVFHLLVLLGTAKSRLTRRFCARLLLSAGVTGGALTSQNGHALVGLLVLGALLPVWDLRARGKSVRSFLLHLLPFVVLLLAGWYGMAAAAPVWAAACLLVGLRLCGGLVPLHGWWPTLCQSAGLGAAMVTLLPLLELVVFLRFVLPHAPEGLLRIVAIACLVTAVYAAGMAVVQEEARRFYAFLALSQTSMVLFAATLHTATSITAALCLWISLVPSLAGLGLSLRSLEARFGALSLREHHGYYEQVPGLAVGFLIAGLASVGFPGTIGFVPMELLISGSSQQGLGYSAILAVAAMLNGIAILRAYFSLFTGRRSTTSVSLRMTSFERTGIVLLALIVFLAGWFSPTVVASRHRVAERLLESRPPALPAAATAPATLK